MPTTLTLAFDAAIATLTLARSEKRNAISPLMIDELLATLDEIESGSARVAIITGAGKAFCAGMDIEALSALAAYSPEQNIEDSRHMARLFRRLYFFPKPLIAAVNGPAIAGGAGIATMCDFTLAVPEATFGYTEVKIGFIPALVSVFLRRQIGEKRARGLLLTGRIFDAAEAHALGLVTEIIPADVLMSRARELATSLLSASPTSLVRTKLLLRRCAEAEIDGEIELAIQENAAIRSTPNFKEGLSSFLEKRPPKWLDH
ncbi:MAG: enoyl-CoA hydratase/isomerase family protein [Acidobacteria bacterium]|nr:enoyl-CoA hydratase/isomerase family protein [Acidobacteriota bacterium]MBI3663143.1 enoyl-CoA hydratase/isomerase family protein [Acidobacteriota bacterium]